jgi:plastocyanin
MRASSTLFLSIIIIAIIMISTIASIFVFGNSLMANAQSSSSSSQLVTSQPGSPRSEGRTFQSLSDSFSVLVPEGWAIHDFNDTGFRLLAEVLQGYGVLAQLCPEELPQQQQQTVSNVSGSSTDNDSCQASQEDIIHIIRYPNLGARIGFASEDTSSTTGNMSADDILAYQIERLNEVGYRGIQIVNSTDTTINIRSSGADTNDISNTLPQATVPAKLVEMTYTTNFAPNETRTGYFISTATDATPRNLGMITGYGIFYEGGNSTASGVETTTTSAGNLAPPSLPAAVRQVFDSFELIAAPQAAQEVEPQEQPVSSLTLDLVSNDTTGVAPATIEFEANIEGGTEPYTINWDFDDGSEESDEETVEHTFDDAGTYDVNLTATDALNQTASDSVEITVEEPSPAAGEEDTTDTTTTTDTGEEPLTDGTDTTTNADENTNEEVIVRIPEGATELTDDAYSPNPVEVTVGDTVTWINDDSTDHTATSGTSESGSTGMFGGTDESPEIIDANGGTQSFTFEETGDFPYYCTIHPNMVGTVIVTEE